MRALIVGANGQVGRELRSAVWPAGTELVALDHASLEIGDADSVWSAIRTFRPTVVINAAAYTAVDRAESEPDTAFKVNRDGPANLAKACAESGALLIHLSTDYVFDGRLGNPWHPENAVAPLGIYGDSKAAGEDAVRAALRHHVIVRTAWVFAAHGQNFVRTMLRVGCERDTLKVVHDQRGGPTAAADLAHGLIRIADQALANDALHGTYHFCGRPSVSWYEFALKIFDLAEPFWHRRPNVTAITSEDWPTPAARPMNSVLDCDSLRRDYGIPQPNWLPSLNRVISSCLTDAQSVGE